MINTLQKRILVSGRIGKNLEFESEAEEGASDSTV